jgi:transcriptional regulator with PAS, ATPase and Fis domain
MICDQNSKYEIISQAPEMEEIDRLIKNCSEYDESVLLVGESGTGKELIARAIHAASVRKDHPFVPVNCAAIPEHLFESELFGHEKGAFTGASIKRKGKFKAADKGTIFLDEIGHMPRDQQPKLLRVLEDYEVVPVGSDDGSVVDTRVILASSIDLKEKVEREGFFESLYYRIESPRITLPPLRERKGDIDLLSNYFLKNINQKYDKDFSLDEDAIAFLNSQYWPGNIRQLKRVICAAAILSDGNIISRKTLEYVEQRQSGHFGDNCKDPMSEILKCYKFEGIEAAAIKYALSINDGNITKAAKLLGFSRVTVYAKIRKYNL